jgi:hypothetical protein
MTDTIKASFHYLNQLNKQFVPIKDAVRIVGSLDLEWSDNFSKEDIQAETDVEIDAISMLPENPEKEMQELQTILQLMVEGLTNPQIAQKIAQEGKTITLSPIIEQMLLRLKIKDPDVFRNIRPEESQGFVSVAEVRAAKDNVNAALQGSPQVPSPPAPNQDHRARLEMYGEVGTILKAIPGVENTPAFKMIMQLIQIQSALLQQQMEEKATPGNKPQLSKKSRPFSMSS